MFPLSNSFHFFADWREIAVAEARVPRSYRWRQVACGIEAIVTVLSPTACLVGEARAVVRIRVRRIVVRIAVHEPVVRIRIVARTVNATPCGALYLVKRPRQR